MGLKRALIRNSICCGLLALSVAIAADPALAQQRSVQMRDMSLSRALREYGRLYGRQLIFTEALVRGKHAPSLAGSYTAEDALQRLLVGSGLAAQRTPVGAIMIVPAAAPAVPAEARSRTGEAEAAGATAGNESAEAQEIVVTAERRQQRLVDAPLSMSVLGSQDISRRGLSSRSDYLRAIPSVNLRDDGPGQSEIVIRGAYGDAFRTGPTVGIYINDVPLTGFVLGGSADVRLVDVERVEVLRGPQGTLYGSNALSGAIKYVTATPNLNRTSGDFEVGYSRTGGFGGGNHYAQAVLNLPIVDDRLAVRAVAFHDFDSGYVRGTAGNDPALQAAAVTYGAGALAVNRNRLGDSETWGLRLSARWQPGSNLNLDLIYSHQTDAQDDRLFELANAGPYRRADFALAPQVGGMNDALKIDVDLINLRASWDLGFGTLYSSTADMSQRYIRKFEIGTILGGGVRPVSQISDTDAGIFTQELRFTSAFRGPLQLIAGLYYEDSDQPTVQETFFGGDPTRNPYAAVKLYRFDLDRVVEQRAAFGEISFEPFENLKLTAGVRAFQYKSRFVTVSSQSVVSFVVPSTSNIRTEESGQTYKARAEYRPSRNMLLYGTFSQGFRLGRPLATDLIRGLCDLNNDGLLDGTDVSSRLDRVDSDNMDSYEVGARLNLGHGGSLSGAVYQNNWKGLPIAFRPPACLTNTTINGGTARARGFEVEGTLSLATGLRANFGLGYVDSELTSTTSLGTAGDRLNFTPKLNGSAGLEYNFRLGGNQAFVRGDYTYFGSYYTQTGERGIRAGDYHRVNLSAGVELSNGFRLQAHVENLFNADDFTSVLGPSGFPAGYGVRLRPRTIGIRLGYALR